MNRALVTGATGMLGAYVVERLRQDGWSVRGLVREASRQPLVQALGGEPRVGDVTCLESLRAAAAGCDAVVHAAAAIGTGRDADAFHLANVVGTRNAVSAAEAAGARLVHVSSTWVFGGRRYFDAPTGETAPLPELPPCDGYGCSKQAAERLVLDAHAERRVWATVVRPPMMYGRGDRQFVPRVAPLFGLGVFPLVGGGRTRLALVHAHAVADGIVRAVQTAAAGGRVYHLTDDFPVTVGDLVRLAALGLGRRVRTVTIAPGAAAVLFRSLGRALRIAGRPDLAPHAAGVFDMLTRDNPFTSERARRELGWAPCIRPQDGLPDAFRWWRERQRARREARRRG